MSREIELLKTWNSKLEEQIKAMREGLFFYANSKNWVEEWDPQYGPVSPAAHADEGHRAREALLAAGIVFDEDG